MVAVVDVLSVVAIVDVPVDVLSVGGAALAERTTIVMRLTGLHRQYDLEMHIWTIVGVKYLLMPLLFSMYSWLKFTQVCVLYP